MDIRIITDASRTTLAVSGMINTDTAAQLQNALLSLDYSGLDLTLDFKDVSYITSAGLRVLLVARKKLTADTMRIIRANDAVAEVFATTGFDSMIRIERSSAADDAQYRFSFAGALEKRVGLDGDKTAFVFLDRPYSWNEVDEASGIIAADLAARGVKKGSHVGICSPNSIQWVFAFFAIQKLGAISVLVNPGLKPEEVATMAKVGDITHLCYGEIPGITRFLDYTAAIEAYRSPIRSMYDISPRLDFTTRGAKDKAAAQPSSENTHADDPSVVIFSSGSTGLPKAILSSAYDQLAGMGALIREMKIDSEDINLAFLPFFHVFGFVTGICGGVLNGYTSVIPESKSPALLIRLIDQWKCTIFNSVPTMMLAMIRTPGFSPEKLASLRLTLLGGSVTTELQMNMLRKLLPNNHFGNIYGMSENAAVSLTAYEDSVEHLTKTVGKPVPGVELEIRDMQTGKPCPQGQPGEIFVRSESMVVCYYKLPVERQPVDDEGWLSTGDLGYLDEDGYLRLTGRAKELIISGGENISPGEIAEVIGRRPEIADVKVFGIPDEVMGELVAAAVVLKKGAEWNEDELRTDISRHLAKYKIPRVFAVFESFPLLGSGKVDGLTLKKQFLERIG